MIDNFKQFELKSSTYDSAANKARSYGQQNKYNKLANWSDIAGTNDGKKSPRDIGLLSFNMGLFTKITNRQRGSIVVSRTLLMAKNKPTDSNLYTKSNEAVYDTYGTIKENPIKGYIGNMDVKLGDDFEIQISLNVLYIDDDHNIISKGFPILIDIPITWQSQTFTLDNKISIGIRNNNSIIDLALSDRVSSNRFKKAISDIKSYYPDQEEKISEFFKEHSYSEEYEKFINLLKNYSVHNLHDTK